MSKIDYSRLLRERSSRFRDDLEATAPISLQDYKNRQSIEAWRHRYLKAYADFVAVRDLPKPAGQEAPAPTFPRRT